MSTDELALSMLDNVDTAPHERVAPSPQPPPARTRDLVLRFESGSLARQTFEFWGARRVVIGRSKDCDIEVFDARVSRQHCALQYDGHSVQVKDLGSANGTLLNGRPTRIGVARDGDLLQLADTRIRIEIGDPDRTVKLRRTERATPSPTARLRDPSLRIEIPGFQLGDVLGQGATSAVFKARRDATGEVVAIKVLKLAESLLDEERERFLREAQTAVRLVHPSVVRVLGHGAVRGRLYNVMEYVRGETVQARIGRLGQLPVPVALHVGRQVASALECARMLNIVHRDVKPENILIQEDGVAKLVDFGLAKPIVKEGAPGLTRVGDVLGTLPYMSPEQLESSVSADHRSDVYSLGATLFHMIAGTTPFSARTSVEYFEKILRQEAPILGLLRRDVPPIVSAMVARCLRKQPELRYERAEELVHLMTHLLASGEQHTTAF